LYQRLRNFILRLSFTLLDQYILRIGAKNYRGPAKPKYSELFKDKNYRMPTNTFIHCCWTQGSTFAPKLANGDFAPEHPPLPPYSVSRWIQVVEDPLVKIRASAFASSPPQQDKFRRFTSIDAMEDDRREFDGGDILSLDAMNEMADQEDQKAMSHLQDEISLNLPAVRPCIKSL
jgi:hypothetical protein